ncbi:hypothetical protein Tco_1577099 [Tanacetum coccineum]
MEDGIFFNQSKYIKEMLKKFGLEESKPMKTPMSSDTKLTKNEECESVDSTKYRGMIGSLLYQTESKPDIMFSVCLCARFQEAPKTSHLEAVKRIFRYIKGTTHLGLWYPKGTGIETVVYADSDHAGDYVWIGRALAVFVRAGHARSRYLNRKEGDAEGRASDWSEVVTRVISQRLAMVRKKGGTGTLGERSTTESFQDGPAAPGKRIEEASDSFMHAPLGSGGYSSVGRAPLLQLGRCDYGLDV